MIAVTGASGYVGGRILSHLRAGGIDAVALARRPAPGDQRARRYALGEPLDSGLLDGIETVVHAAYDASVQGEEIRAVNVSGSLPLIDGVAERGGRVLLISSLSAFAGARSRYGRAKLELERAVLGREGVVLRPGLVFGPGAGGLFGAMVKALSRHALAPMIGGGWQRLFVTHDEHLAELVVAIVTGEAPAERTLFAAHEVPTTPRAIAEQIARAHGRRLEVIPLPPPLVQLGLRCAEIARVRLPFRSDSLLSLLTPIPLDEVSALARSSIDFPPLAAALWHG
ncbi:MAG TPA: NAD-dependent epimerase/dehydratase family protein [Solirubrobacteraceae bacterium]|jgi:nucleoside-diphosphate-sugar epimerase